jgi:hypothetical protein
MARPKGHDTLGSNEGNAERLPFVASLILTA